MSARYRAVAAPTRVEIPKIKGSRFVADLFPVRNEADVEARLQWLRTEFSDASHHCWAWRLGPGGERFRFSDAGEPSGTAGRPILQHLEGTDVTDALLVVMRWFGGTKLGAGGLVRAYGSAAAAALAEAPIEVVRVRRPVVVEHRYEDTAAVAATLTALGQEPQEADYGEEVRLLLRIPVDEVDGFVAELRERTGGRARITSPTPDHGDDQNDQ